MATSVDRVGRAALAAAFLFLLTGCPTENFPEQLTPDETQVNQIVNNDALSAQEKRRLLGDLGIPPTTINFFLDDERTGNQFGGDLRTAFTKVNESVFTRLTPDEIQIYADAASAVDGPLNITLSDEQAQNIVIFFGDNFINTAAQLEAFLDDPANAGALPGQVSENNLRDLFVEFDPSRVLAQL